MNNFIVIGAGIVGLAAAYKLLKAKPGAKVLVLEKEDFEAKHQTGNNSGVIHSGIYYKPGSLKALNCRNGYNQLLHFCNQNGIKYELCGKTIVATDDSELLQLEKIYQRGIENGLDGLRIISKDELKELEPCASGVKAIYVPQTGIIDFKEVAAGYKKQILNSGGEILFGKKVINISKRDKSVYVETENESFKTEVLISCAGLQSDRIASKTNKNLGIKIIPFRGEYYKLKDESKHLVKNLIYPVPDPAFPFLGVHFTRMIDGSVECGPNAVFSFKREGYSKTSFSLNDTLDSLLFPGFQKVMFKYWKTGLGEFHRSFNKKAFVKALQKLIPQIRESDIVPGGAGVRAQACEKSAGLIDDFLIIEDANIFHVCNAPSPAATSSLSIGEYIAKKVLGFSLI